MTIFMICINMSWSTILWTLLMWTGYIYPTTGDPTHISYNGYDFLKVSKISNRFNRGTLDLSTYDNIRSHWMWFDQAFIKSKDYTVEWILFADTSVNLEIQIDYLTQACQKPNQLLKIKRRDGTITQAYATVTQVDIPEEHYNITFIPYSVTITVLEPFMYAGPLYEEERLNQTGAFGEAMVYEVGNEVWYPFILMNFDAGTTATEVTVGIGEHTITIEEEFEDGDTLLVNCKNKEVMKNSSTSVLFKGTFPHLDFGSNTVSITVDGTYDADIYLLYYPSYA